MRSAKRSSNAAHTDTGQAALKTTVTGLSASSGRGGCCHRVLRDDDPDHRAEVASALLDELRRNLAIDVEALGEDGFDRVRRLSAQHLREPWSLLERELPPAAGVAFPGPGKHGLPRHNVSGRGLFGASSSASMPIRRSSSSPRMPRKSSPTCSRSSVPQAC